MKKFIPIIGAGILGLVLPIAGMTITPTRDLILGLAPEEAILTLADKIDEQRAKDEEQTAQLTSLQTENEQQKAELEKLNDLNFEEKKNECETRLKTIQDNLASSQRHLGEDQAVLKLAEADKCQDCYTNCLKGNNCDKSGCDYDDADFDKIKKECRERHEENIGFRKDDVNGDLASIAKGEKDLAALKTECEQYLAN